MNVIVCIDDKNGMMFNHRRQSRDRLLIANVIDQIGDSKIWISPFSKDLFKDYANKIIVSESFFNDSADNDYCFVENMHLLPYLNKIKTLIVYKWNRIYPSDFKLDIDLNSNYLNLSQLSTFVGSSHDEITKEIYVLRQQA